MFLQYQNLIIRDAAPKDAAQLAEWWNDGAVMAHAGFPRGLGVSPEEIRDSLKADSDETRRRLIVEKDRRPIGEMTYRNKGDRTAEIGIKICDFSEQNKGLGKILLSMLIAALFREMGCEKIVLDTNLSNKRAQHVYEKLGFCKICVLENSWQNQLGEWQSAVCYELRPEEFISYIEESPF